MAEYERVIQQKQRDRLPQQSIHNKFVGGLKILSTRFDALVKDFAFCAGQIVEDPKVPTQLQKMMAFAQEYHQFGLDAAIGAIEENSGVPVEVEVEDGSRSPRKRGAIIGLLGAEIVEGGKVFSGIAIIDDARGGTVVPVLIRPNGFTILHPQYVLNSKADIEQLYPPTQKIDKGISIKGK